MRLKLFRSIPSPNISTPRYIGWRNHLYIPTVIKGAPGFGIGETLSEGRSAMYAKAKMVTALTYRAFEIQAKVSNSTSIAPAGFRNKNPKRPNWSVTSALALIITSYRTSC